MDGAGTTEIGARARMIRRRRGLSLAVAAGLAGLSKFFLSMLENGTASSSAGGCWRTWPPRWAVPWPT